MAKQPTFKYDEWRERKQQSFDKDEIFIEKAGKKINVFQMIQESKDDCEPYTVLEKYGCLDKMTLNNEGTYADFTEMQKMGNIYEQQLRADKLWESLPLEVRQEFHHNKKEFVQNGKQWLENKIKQEQEQEQEQKQNETPKGDNVNE